MTFRRRLLASFSLTVILSVAAVTWIVSYLARRTFDQADERNRQALVMQFQREFDRRGQEILRRVQVVRNSDTAVRMATSLGQGNPDYASYLNEAKSQADSQQLDFLEFVAGDGTILSSAQAPAAFGYQDLLAKNLPSTDKPFWRKENLPEGPAIALSAAASVAVGEKPMYIIGGLRINSDFLASLEPPPGMRVMLYQNFGASFDPALLIFPKEKRLEPEKLDPLVSQVVQTKADASQLVHWSSSSADDELVQAIPIDGTNDQVLGILLIANTRLPYVELREHIRSTGLLVGGAGILLAVLFGSWIAARFTHPVEQLAKAATDVAAGDWNIQVPVASSDELGILAESFNRMTRDLLDQKDRALQAERVAAWRDLARRLGHELKNPLFPLQLTVENLVRAREQSPQLFEEIFQESATTLLAEIANLKSIISRFSDFSRMPQPQLREVNVNEIVRDVARLFQAQLRDPARPQIACLLALSDDLPPVAADAELLHRALSNLVLNAMEAMPDGGTLSLRTLFDEQDLDIEISDTGSGLTPEECSRLFTPYYTSKSHGTGLGLAIVQSIVSDHKGRISVRSDSGRGTTFLIKLPRDYEKASSLQNSYSAKS